MSIKLLRSTDFLKLALSLIYFILLLLTSNAYCSEENQDIKEPIDLLGNHNSSAAIILGVSPDVISRPTSPQMLITSLMSVTDSFKAFPSCYNLEIAPSWFFAGDYIQYSDYISNRIDDALLQDSTLSLATKQSNNKKNEIIDDYSYGIYLPLVRGNCDTKFVEHTTKMHNLAIEYAEEINIEWAIITKKYPELTKEEALNKAIETVHSEKALEIEKEASELKWQRSGFKWDIAGAILYSYSKNVLIDRYWKEYAGWSTIGWDSTNNSILGVARYRKDKIQNKLTSIDGGIKLILNQKNVSLSLESIYKYLNIAHSYRIKISTTGSLKITKKLILPISFGYEFSPTYKNMIAAFSIMFGAGKDFLF
jgi:hypothetical protein